MPEIIKLTAQAAELKQEVAALRAALTRFEPRIERAERVSTRTAIAATIVLVLVMAVGFVGYRYILLDNEVGLTNQRVDGLCPILALVVGGADPNTRAPGPDRDQYIQSVEVMRKAYSDLGCTTPFVPPRQPGAMGPTS